jgi:hypothetical protein
MVCPSCGSAKCAQFNTETMIHGVGNVDTPGVLSCPRLAVCLDCGLSTFMIGESELISLKSTSQAA